MDPLYELALKQAENLAATAANISAVGRGTSAEAARWAFTQWSLRQRAAAKFAFADRMLFDRDGLEMATHEAVAAYHASLFPERCELADLTVGIGADLIAFCHRCLVTGVELDPDRAALARYNASVHGYWPEVAVGDALDVLKRGGSYFFADPSRREGGRRTLDPSQFAPDPSVLANYFGAAKLGVMKLSPMLPDSFLEPLGKGLEFVSFDGECREALVFNGSDATEGRWAVQAETGERLSAGGLAISVEEPDEFLHEADPAAIRAHGLATLADRHGLRGLGDSNGYLTGGAAVQSPWLRSYRVLYAGRGDVGATKKELLRLDSATPILKQRGVGQDIDQLRKQLRFSGSRELVLVLYPIGKSVRHVVVEAIP